MAHSYDNTLLQRMGFSDPDRKTPAHDDACIEIATDPERFIRAFKELRLLRNARCELEVPLQKGDGKYASTVGFIDAMVTYEVAEESVVRVVGKCKHGLTYSDCVRESSDASSGPSLDPYNDDAIYTPSNNGTMVEWTRELEAEQRRAAKIDGREFTNPPMRNGFELNYDHRRTWAATKKKHSECPRAVQESRVFWSSDCALIEVKTQIDNLGFLLRQMNLYREYKKLHGHDVNRGTQLQISDYVIWSLDPADSKYTNLLAQQGYTLIVGPLP